MRDLRGAGCGQVAPDPPIGRARARKSVGAAPREGKQTERWLRGAPAGGGLSALRPPQTARSQPPLCPAIPPRSQRSARNRKGGASPRTPAVARRTLSRFSAPQSPQRYVDSLEGAEVPYAVGAEGSIQQIQSARGGQGRPRGKRATCSGPGVAQGGNGRGTYTCMKGVVSVFEGPSKAIATRNAPTVGYRAAMTCEGCRWMISFRVYMMTPPARGALQGSPPITPCPRRPCRWPWPCSQAPWPARPQPCPPPWSHPRPRPPPQAHPRR